MISGVLILDTILTMGEKSIERVWSHIIKNMQVPIILSSKESYQRIYIMNLFNLIF